MPPNQATVDAVRERADLVELVRDRVDLTRRGGRWWGRCPFHEERSPSFSLLPPDFRRYYCHGCLVSGDAIDWAQTQGGAGGFYEAIEQLAERFGIPVEYRDEDPAAKARRAAEKAREDLMDRAATFFARVLWQAREAEPARRYLAERGFERPLIERFRVGYAPASGTALATKALAEGFSPDQMIDAGLGRRRGRTVTDFFSARIMFPIADAQGRVQGFGGRTLDPAERAKYVNSPEGPNFRKRTLLFGLAEARAAAARSRYFVVCEGYTDVMGMVASGVESAVACMGTSLTAEQIALLRRWAPEVKLCFDADSAGEGAAWRSVEAASGVNLSWSAVQLPIGQDPGDLARTGDGRAELARAVEGAQPLVSSLIRSRIARAGESPRKRDEALEAIAELLRRFPESVEKEYGVQTAVDQLRLSQALEERFRAAVRRDVPVAPVLPERKAPPAEVRERRFLAMALALPAAARPYLESLPPDAFQVDGHRAAFEAIRAGATAPDDLPEELRDVALALTIELADATPTTDELREAAYRVELPMLERRAAERRAAGDEAGRLEALDLARRVRAALRGER